MIQDREYLARRQRLQHLLVRQGARHFVATASDSIYYLCGASFEALERPFFLILSTNGELRFIVPLLERDHLKKARVIDPQQIHCYRDYPAPDGQCWRSALLEYSGLEPGFIFEDSCPSALAQFLGELGGRHQSLVERLRQVKSPDEIQMIRHAARYADQGVRELLRQSYYGATVAEGFARNSKVMQAIIRETPDWDALSTRVLMVSFPAPLSAKPHSVPAVDDRLLEGPHVALVLTRVNGYAAESERTYFTAPPRPEERQLFDLMVRARQLGLSLLRPGRPCAEIDARVNQFLAAQGMGDPQQRLHRIGHGFGLGNHEGPWLAEGSEDVLEAGMVVSIEPGLYIEGCGGYRHSDTVLITHDGYELLTRAPGVEEPLVLRRRGLGQRLYGHLVQRSLGIAGRP